MLFDIQRDGTVANLRTDKPSGFSALDIAANRAIQSVDSFGPLPEAAENLVTLNELKLAAASRRITAIECKDEKAMLKRGGDFILLGTKFPRLTAATPPASPLG